MCMCVSLSALCVCNTHRAQKRTLHPLELEFKVAVSCYVGKLLCISCWESNLGFL